MGKGSEPAVRRIVTLGLIVLLVSGCAAQPAAPQAPAAPAATPTPAPTATPTQAPREPAAGPRPNTPSGLKPEPAGGLKELIAQAPAGTLRRLQFTPGQPIGHDGAYFLNVQTSAVEGWLPGAAVQNGYLDFISDDNRWVSGGSQSNGYLADRQTGTVYQWDLTAARLVAARSDLLLMMTGSRFWVVGDGLRRFTPVDVTPVPVPAADIAPDGSALVLLTDQKLYLVQTTSGQARALEQIDPPATATNSGVALSRGRQGQEVIVSLTYTTADGGGGARIRRYSWQGQVLDERTAPGAALFAPAGKAVAWKESILGLASALIVGTPDLQPRLRLRGQFTCSVPNQGPFWLADSSGLVVSTTRGPRLLKLDGTLETTAAVGAHNAFPIPVPAPDRINLYAVGATVVDGSGKKLAAAVSSGPNGWPAVLRGTPWGARSDELRFILLSLGKGVSCDPSIFAPSVDRAPFPRVTGLSVKVAAGDCVNLRQAFTREAPVVSCLPDGTRLTPATGPGINNKGELRLWPNPAPQSMGGEWWWYARTPQGQSGWVYLSDEYLTWTDAKPGEVGPNTLGPLDEGPMWKQKAKELLAGLP